MPSILALCAGLCLTLGLAGSLSAAEPATPVSAEHTHLRQVPTVSKVGYATRSVTCTETHPEHTHRWFKAGDKRPGQWISEACTQVHPQTQAKVCPSPAPKGGCAHKPRC